MSRSRKKAWDTVSPKIDKSTAHKKVRKQVKETLLKMDLDDPPIIDIEADTRSIGLEEMGTKMGYDFLGLLSEEEWAEEGWEEDRRKATRK